MEVRITGDMSKVEASIDATPKLAMQTYVHSINRVATSARTYAIRKSSKDLKIKQKLIRGRVSKMRRASWKRPDVVFRVRLDEMPASVLGGRVTKAGWKYKGQLYAGAFRARMANGHENIFVRKASSRGKQGRDSKNRLKAGRLPIATVSVEINRPIIRNFAYAMRGFAHRKFNELYPRELERRMQRASR